MFVHRHHLRNLLRPEHYSSTAHQRLEVERLFAPAWHPVGVRGQLARPGDRLSLDDLLGERLTVWNDAGVLRAVRTGPHRGEPVPILVGTWGEVVFVRLADGGATLEEFLAPARTDWADGFGPPFRYAGAWHVDFPCDWKVVLENALETYHVPELHAKTFGDMLPEEDCEHDLRPNYTFFAGNVKQDWITRRMNGLVRRLGMPVTNQYRHLLIHPHVQFSRLDVYRMVQAVYPTGPRTCRYSNFLFSLWGHGNGPLKWLQGWFLRWAVVHTARKVLVEDGSIFAAVQRGVEASPFPGVIGTREERIQPFQRFVLEGCGLPVPADPAPPVAEAV